MTPVDVARSILDNSRVKMIIDGHLPAEESVLCDAVHADHGQFAAFSAKLVADVELLSGTSISNEISSLEPHVRQNSVKARAGDAYRNLGYYLKQLLRMLEVMPSHSDDGIASFKVVAASELPRRLTRRFRKLNKKLNYEYNLTPVVGYGKYGDKRHALLAKPADTCRIVHETGSFYPDAHHTGVKLLVATFAFVVIIFALVAATFGFAIAFLVVYGVCVPLASCTTTFVCVECLGDKRERMFQIV